jgi:LacI family gluconate utilization system Gnt-I transcriptional repressor
MSSRTPRLEEVAAEAGVSTITASRALRQPEKVAPETRARIEAAVARLGYVPNLLAGALASARSRTVAILVPTLASSMFAETIDGLTEALEARGYAILVAQSGYDASRERRALSALLGRRPEALVMVGSPSDAASATLLQRAVADGTRVVETWEKPRHAVDALVAFDNAAAGRMVAAHFARAGRRRLHFVGGEDRRARTRLSGFEAAAKAAGLPRPGRSILPAPASMEDAARLGAGLAELPDAVFAATDVHAVALLDALLRRGVRVPEEVAVVGLGDLPMARHCRPALSTVRVDGAAIGRRAAAVILGEAEGGAMPGELVLRESG